MFTDPDLFEEMPKLRKFAFKLTHNIADTEDLTQTTLLKAIEHRDDFETGSNLFGWTSKIMFNTFAVNYRRNKVLTAFDPEIYINTMISPENQTHALELKTVDEALDNLSPEYKDVFIAICIKGKAYEETAEDLHIPIGTVRSRLCRARRELHSYI